MPAPSPRLTTLAAAAILTLAAFGAPAQAATTATAASSPSAKLVSVAAVSKSDAWAVGSLIERWNGHAWRVVPGAKTAGCTAFLNAVAAGSASSAWAVGYCGKSTSHRPIIERWNGRHWSVQPGPGVTASAMSQLNGVALTRSGAWAVGEYESKGRTLPLIEHWNGHAWRVQASPNPGPHGALLAGVIALSPNSAWAVGGVLNTDGAAGKSLAEHWNGHGWQIQPTISPGTENGLIGVTALTSTQVWAAGFYTFGNSPVNFGTLVERWDGASWQEPATPGTDLQEALSGIAARTATDVWTVGERLGLLHPRTLILHWNGTDWTIVASPSPSADQDTLASVAVLSASYAWAVGYQGRYRTLIEHWNGFSWKVIPSPN